LIRIPSAVRESISRTRLVAFAATLAGIALFPLSARADSLSEHAIASLSAVLSTAIGPETSTAISSESEAGSNFEVKLGWRNTYPSGGTFVTARIARRAGLFPEQESLVGGGLGSIFVPGDESREQYQLVQEFDDPSSGVERLEASIGTSIWHGTAPYRTRYASIDYYAGSIGRFGYDGYSRQFDLCASYVQTTSGHLMEISPTYAFPLASGGRTSAWASLTLDTPIGSTPERYAGVTMGITHQAGERVGLALSLTRYWARDQIGAYSRRLELSTGVRYTW
jgi:hypothetical protein